MQYKTIYLTGIAASGKTTFAKLIDHNVSDVRILGYSQLLGEVLSMNHSELRKESAEIIRTQDVRNVDEQLIELIKNYKMKSNLLIDSHPVTKESFGFRATPFSYEQILKLGIDYIICMQSNPDEILQRMKLNKDNRKELTIKEIENFIQLQEGLALTYSVLSGVPVYFLNSMTDTDSKVGLVLKMLSGTDSVKRVNV